MKATEVHSHLNSIFHIQVHKSTYEVTREERCNGTFQNNKLDYHFHPFSHSYNHLFLAGERLSNNVKLVYFTKVFCWKNHFSLIRMNVCVRVFCGTRISVVVVLIFCEIHFPLEEMVSKGAEKEKETDDETMHVKRGKVVKSMSTREFCERWAEEWGKRLWITVIGILLCFQENLTCVLHHSTRKSLSGALKREELVNGHDYLKKRVNIVACLAPVQHKIYSGQKNDGDEVSESGKWSGTIVCKKVAVHIKLSWDTTQYVTIMHHYSISKINNSEKVGSFPACNDAGYRRPVDSRDVHVMCLLIGWEQENNFMEAILSQKNCVHNRLAQ